MKHFNHMFRLFIFMIAIAIRASDKTAQHNINDQLDSNCQTWHKLKKTQSCSYRMQKTVQHTCTCCAICAAVYGAHQLSVDTPAYLSNPNFHALCFYGLLGKTTCDCIDNTIEDCYTRPLQAAEYQECIQNDVHTAYRAMSSVEQSIFILTYPAIYRSFENNQVKKMS